MLTFALMLMLQTLRTGTASDYATPMTYEISGRVVVGLDEPVGAVDVKLTPISASRTPAQTMQTFANGTFRFEGVELGTYMLGVVNPRFDIYQDRLILAEPDDTSKPILIRLIRNGESGTLPAPDAELYAIDAAPLAKTPAKAVEEFNKGVEAIRNPAKNNPPDAHFKRSIAAAPDFYEAHLQLGLELQRQKKKDEAAQSFERAAELRPEEARPLSLLGQLYSETEKYQKAIDALSKLDQLGKMTSHDQFNLGTAFYRLDRLPEAQKYLLAAINSGNDTDPAPFLQLHNVFMKERAGGPALEVLEDYLKLFPNDPNHAVMLGRAQQMRKVFGKP